VKFVQFAAASEDASPAPTWSAVHWLMAERRESGELRVAIKGVTVNRKSGKAILVGSVLATGLLASELRGEQLPRPKWLGKEPLIIAGNWDSMPIFRRRVGGNPVWQEADYAREHTEEAVQKLKDLGVTMLVMHFYKGFGLEAEAEHIADARKLAALCKKHGLRVGVYVGSTIAYETFLREKPEAESWLAPPYLGRPVVYFDQTFRKRVYFMHPGYREYMKRVLRLAVEDLKVDLIHFDNTSLQAEAPIFSHPMAIEDFRQYLRNKYSPEMAERRFGFRDLGLARPPEWDAPVSVINDPLWQEWTQFRCAQLNAYYAEMERYIRGLNPDVVVESNPHSGISGINTAWLQGIDYPGLLSHMDIVWTEEGNEAGVTPDGILISKIRTYKMAALLKNRIFTYTGGGRASKLAMAEAMAYNRQCLGMVGGALAGYELPEEQRKYVRFYRDHFDDLYREVENRADVAVLHSFASMAYNNDRPWQSSMLLEQALIQAKVPFDIIFDDNLKDLSKYRVLALPDQECLADAQVALIRDWVNRGGGLVATGFSSLYTDWRQRRRAFGLSGLIKIEAPRWAGGESEEALPDVAPVRDEAGQGRAAYLPAIRPAVPKPPSVSMTANYWKLPVNSQELISAVQWAAGGRLSMDVNAPPTVTAELLEQKDKQRLMVHLINYAAERTAAIAKIDVRLRLPEGRQVSEVSLLSPDEDGVHKLRAGVKAGDLLFTVPRLQTYSVAVVQLR
jgi:hypothetical protein